MKTKICEVCGKEFVPPHKHNRFCSRKCGSAGRGGVRKTLDRTPNCHCAFCGNAIWRKPYLAREGKKFYCNSVCRGEHKRTLDLGASNPNFRDAGKRHCIACGKAYQSYNKLRRYCGTMCSRAYSASEAMANLKRGAEAERMCVAKLKEMGFIAFRSAGSKGPFDVIGISETEILLIQVKRTRAMVRRKHSGAMRDLMQVVVPALPIIKKQLWVFVDKNGWHIYGAL